jgi:hypothetical protein
MQPNYSLALPMRPQALLYAIAMCLLLTAATAWAPPIPEFIRKPPPEQEPAFYKSGAESSTSRVQKLLGRSGLPDEGVAARLKKLSGRPESLDEDVAARLKKASAREQPAALTQEELEQRLKEFAGPQLKLLQRIVPGLSPPFIVDASVKRFSAEFAEGAKDPDRFLSEISLSQPRISKWLKATPDKRIFIIGAGKDSAEVSAWTELLESDGYSVFFYKFCSESGGALCSSKVVGAMFGKSRWTAVYQTPFAKLSEYVKVEAATAGFLEGLNPKVVLISTPELLYASRVAMYVVNMPTSTPSPVLK